MSKLVWASPGGSCRIIDTRENLPRPLLLLEVDPPSEKRVIYLTPEDVDGLWANLTKWLHELPDDVWASPDHGIHALVRSESEAAERDFAARLETQRKEPCCPWCNHFNDLHTASEGDRLGFIGSDGFQRTSVRCAVDGCPCIILGVKSDSQEIVKDKS